MLVVFILLPVSVESFHPLSSWRSRERTAEGLAEYQQIVLCMQPLFQAKSLSRTPIKSDLFHDLGDLIYNLSLAQVTNRESTVSVLP